MNRRKFFSAFAGLAAAVGLYKPKVEDDWVPFTSQGVIDPIEGKPFSEADFDAFLKIGFESQSKKKYLLCSDKAMQGIDVFIKTNA